MSNDGAPRQATVLTLVSNARRRRVIWTLAALDAPVDVETLTGFVVSLEAADTAAATQWQDRRSVRHNLKQRHLVQLSEAGIITWTDTVQPGPHFPIALRTLAASGTAPSVTHD